MTNLHYHVKYIFILHEIAMPLFVYVFKNEDLYNIGRSDNLETSKKNLRPGKIFAVLKTNNSEDVLNKLKDKYSSLRIPESNYYRLSDSQAEDCKSQLLQFGGSSDIKPLFSGPRLVLTFMIFWGLITFAIIKLGIDPLFDLIT